MTYVSGAHEIEYAIHGAEAQFVEVILDPGEAAIAEVGSMMFMEAGIQMLPILGDGSTRTKGVVGKLLGAGKRMLTGENFMVTQFLNKGSGKKSIGFTAPYPGKIMAFNLLECGGAILCQKGAFLCGARGVAIGIAFQRKLGAMMFGGEGIILQKLEGDGIVFVHSGGTIHEMDLQAGEVVYVDTGSVVALQPAVTYDIEMITNIKTMLFGSEGYFLTKLTGPGKVWLQSMPFGRLSGMIVAHAIDAFNGAENRG